MKGDFTRLSFDKSKHYRGVLMQQGRVQLDSDWNEQVQIAEHRYSTFFGDIVGQSGAPAEDAMALSLECNNALGLGGKTYIRAGGFQIKSLSAVTIELWFRPSLSKGRCILSLDDTVGFGVAADGFPCVKLLSKKWMPLLNRKKIDDGNWHYLAAVIKKTKVANVTTFSFTVTTYLDGIKIDERSSSINKAANQPLLKMLTIGAWVEDGKPSDYFGGDVAELQVWDGAKKAAELAMLPLAGLTEDQAEKEKSLMRYYKFNERDQAKKAVDLSIKKINADITGKATGCDGPYKTGKSSLSKGRYYVDGLLVENENTMTLDALPADSNGLYIYYLDVWQREVSAAEDQNLKEQALGGPDTAVRMKTEWRVRLQNIDYLQTNDTTLIDICKRYRGTWPEIPAPTSADYWQLALGTGQMKIDTTNFQFTDNRLYRVEIHRDNYDENDTAIEPIFKWSRDNGSVVAPVSTVDKDTNTISITDKSLNIQNAFSGAVLVEVCDLECTHNCAPGYLGTVDKAKSDLSCGKIVIQEWIGGRQPNQTLSAMDKSPIIVRRWDGYSVKTSLEPEKGLKVSLTGGIYRSGDYWLVLVRSDGAHNWKNGESRLPDGIEHHYAALALLDIIKGKIKSANDLGVVFQPLASGNVSKLGDTIDGDLAVLGRLSVGSSVFNAPLSIAATTNGALVSLGDTSGTEQWRISEGSGSTPSLSITDSGGKGLTILKEGNVGIGTNPEAKLHIKQDGTDWHSGIRINDGNNDWAILADGDGTKKMLTIAPYGDYSKGLVIKDGKVGIGINQPEAALDVCGKIRCQNARSQVTAINQISTTSSVYVDMDKMQLTVTTLDNPVLVVFKVPAVWMWVSPNNDEGWGTFRILIDDKEKATTYFHANIFTQEITLMWMEVLGSGTHIIKGQWRSEQGNKIMACGWGAYDPAEPKYGSRQLIVIEL